jgi:hypothetical protein
VTSRALIRWMRLSEQRSRGAWRSPAAVAIAAGAALAAWVIARGGTVAGASHAWLAAALAISAVAFLRVPFLVYWRADAAFLAQLPIAGGALVDAALYRCARAAAATTLALVIGAVALLAIGADGAVVARHVAFAVTLGVAAAAAVPAIALYTAGLVAGEQEAQRIGAATATPPAALLGAGPGFAATAILAVVAAASPWLLGGAATLPPAPALGGVAGAGVLALVAARGGAKRVMAKVLRDVSALDRQRLATLEIRPPTALERAVGALLGDGALPYGKDCRLMRRRYPMAFALGGLGFVVLVVVGLARPADPVPYLATVLGGAVVYAAVLAGRLGRAPIELARLTATLPVARGAVARARVAWVVTWLAVFAVAPAVFALARL